mgnify:CR=1 FL=1
MARSEEFVYISDLDKIHTSSKIIIRSIIIIIIIIIIKLSSVGSQCKKIGYNITGAY